MANWMPRSTTRCACRAMLNVSSMLMPLLPLWPKPSPLSFKTTRLYFGLRISADMSSIFDPCVYWERPFRGIIRLCPHSAKTKIRPDHLGERGCVSAPSSPGANATGLALLLTFISSETAPMMGVMTIRGRGTAENPPNRFETIRYEADPDASAPSYQGWGGDDESPAPATQFLRDTSRSIIAYNDSPDIGFEASINPYRGCEHGCVYCYARPTHEYLGLSSGLDFETKIFVKEDAPELLRRELSSPRWQPKVPT